MTGDKFAQLLRLIFSLEAVELNAKIAKIGRFDEVLAMCCINFLNIILSPRPPSWDTFFKETPLPSEDFMATRENLPPQSRYVLDMKAGSKSQPNRVVQATN